MRTLLVLASLILAIGAPAATEPMKAGDRQRLIAHLEMTEQWLVSELQGLSQAQLQFHLTPESWSLTDVVEHLRTNRARTGEAREPKGRWNSTHGSLGEFRKLRATMLEYARTTQDDLRSRLLLEGSMDVYQWFLMISTHAQRHILQIREVKAHPGYPKGGVV